MGPGHYSGNVRFAAVAYKFRFANGRTIFEGLLNSAGKGSGSEVRSEMIYEQMSEGTE